MTTYLIAQLQFTDVQAYRRYQKAFPAVFRKFNAELLVADESPETVDGQSKCDKVVVMRFPDPAEALRFRNDPDYLKIAEDRMVGAKSVTWQVQGLSYVNV